MNNCLGKQKFIRIIICDKFKKQLDRQEYEYLDTMLWFNILSNLWDYLRIRII